MVEQAQIDQDEETLRIQMEETRDSLTDRIGRLEEKVSETVESATSSMAEATATVMETVQNATSSVSETVDTVTNAVQGTMDSVRLSVEGTVDSVKGVFDLNHHVQEHPWLMLAGAVAVGYGAYELLRGTSPGTSDKRSRSANVLTSSFRTCRDVEGQSFAKPSGLTRDGSFLNGSEIMGESTTVPQSDPRGWWDLMGEKLAPEFGKLEELALGTVLGSFRDMLIPNVPRAIQKSLVEILDTATEKVGGKCIKSSLFNNADDLEESSVSSKLPIPIPESSKAYT